MVKLEGIIYKVFGNYVVLRGFAPIKDLAAISHRSESYQRNANKEHLKEIITFLDSGEYKYFPEITLAYRVQNYSDFALSIGVDNSVNQYSDQFVEGLNVLTEKSYTAYGNYRAPHANLTKTTNDLVRVDGNHRLAPFDDENKEIWKKTKADKKKLGELVVPFTVIFSSKDKEDKDKDIGESFEAGIFHNINFRQLPLREETSLKIISELNTFTDKEILGDEYPLALKLIEEMKTGRYDSIHWLKAESDTDNSYFRTACLRIVQLLLSQKGKINELLSKTQDKIKTLDSQINEQKEKTEKFEIGNSNFKDMSQDKSAVREYKDIKLDLNIPRNEYDMLVQEQNHLKYKLDSLKILSISSSL